MGFSKNNAILSLTDKKEELPDMFFYLLNSSGDPVCFQRISSTSFHLNDQIMIIKLFPEPCYDKVKPTINSGLLKTKIVLYNNTTEKSKIDLTKFRENSGDEKQDDLETYSAIGIGRKLGDFYTVVCVVYMCRY